MQSGPTFLFLWSKFGLWVNDKENHVAPETLPVRNNRFMVSESDTNRFENGEETMDSGNRDVSRCQVGPLLALALCSTSCKVSSGSSPSHLKGCSNRRRGDSAGREGKQPPVNNGRRVQCKKNYDGIYLWPEYPVNVATGIRREANRS